MSSTTSFDCPRCGTLLTMSERQGIEIDYCQQCRGVWLDRGELDKIIERAEAMQAAPVARPAVAPPPPPAAPAGWTQPAATGWQQPPPQGWQQPQPQGWQQPVRHGDRYRDDDRYRQGYQKKKSKGWLGELFD